MKSYMIYSYKKKQEKTIQHTIKANNNKKNVGPTWMPSMICDLFDERPPTACDVAREKRETT